MNIAKMIFLLRVYQRDEMSLELMNTEQISIAQSLLENGLLQEHGDKWPYMVTKKGCVLIDEWLDTPMPVATWVIER